MPETEGAVVIGSRWLPTISTRYRKARGRARKFKSPPDTTESLAFERGISLFYTDSVNLSWVCAQCWLTWQNNGGLMCHTRKMRPSVVILEGELTDSGTRITITFANGDSIQRDHAATQR